MRWRKLDLTIVKLFLIIITYAFYSHLAVKIYIRYYSRSKFENYFLFYLHACLANSQLINN